MNKSMPKKKTITGTVISDKMDKTVTIVWERRMKHPLYGKYISKHKKIKAHDPGNEVSVGDVVKIQETRPISRDKCWRVLEVLEKGQRG